MWARSLAISAYLSSSWWVHHHQIHVNRRKEGRKWVHQEVNCPCTTAATAAQRRIKSSASLVSHVLKYATWKKQANPSINTLKAHQNANSSCFGYKYRLLKCNHNMFLQEFHKATPRFYDDAALRRLWTVTGNLRQRAALRTLDTSCTSLFLRKKGIYSNK